MGKGSRATLAIPQLQKNAAIRAFNFSAGAAMFDTSVMLKMQQELLSYEHSGMSLTVSSGLMLATFSPDVCPAEPLR